MQEVGRAVIESSDGDFIAHFFLSAAAVTGTFLACAARGVCVSLLKRECAC